MEKIASFQVDHLRLKPGLYVSRRDRFGDTILTTFDLRLKQPNTEPVIDVPALHTIEHLGATFLRNHKTWAKRVVYFGPMGEQNLDMAKWEAKHYAGVLKNAKKENLNYPA